MCVCNSQMDNYLSGKGEIESPEAPSDADDFQEALDVSLDSRPNSPPPPPPPPAQTLDEQLHSSSVPEQLSFDGSSNSGKLSPPLAETLDDQFDPAFLLDIDCQEDVEEEEIVRSSPVRSFYAYDSLECAERPESWYSSGDTKPYASHWSQPWPSAGEPNSSALMSGQRPTSGETETETETEPSVSVSPAWLNDSKPSMVGAGLANLGNTCFLNAILQCFTHTVPLVQGLLSCNHKIPCDSDIERYCVLCSLRGHVELSLASMGGVLSPLKLVDNLSYFSSSFRRFQQEDAHEFLQCLLDRLDSCYDELKRKNINLSSEDDNLVKQVFGGRLISKLRCCNCSHCSDTYEPLIDLSLEIEDVDNLPSALKSFTKVEKIEDPEVKFTCENCKEVVTVEKQLMLDQAPTVAAFHLKRFKNDGSYVEKIEKHVEFPLELDLLPYTNGCQDTDVDLKYNLFAVVVHTGFSSTSGHYYCFIRSAPDTWYRMDDSKVMRVREDYVLSQEAYILFYAKQSTPWFSSFVETQKPFLDSNILSTSPKSVLENMENICMSSPTRVNSHTCEGNETRDDADGVFPEFSNGARHAVEVNKATDEFHRLSTPLPVDASNSRDEKSCELEKNCSPVPLGEHNLNQKSNDVKPNANITPQTPPRSPSPDIYSEEPPEALYSIPRPQPSQSSCQRQTNKVLEDSKKQHAIKYLKTMPSSSRRSQLLEAMSGSRSEGSVNKKRSRILDSSRKADDHRGTQSEGSKNKKRTRQMDVSPNGGDHRSSARLKTNLSSMMRPVAAGSFR